MEIINLFKIYLVNKKVTNKVTLKNYLSDIRHFKNWYENSFGVEFTPNALNENTIKLYEGSQGALIRDGQIDDSSKLSHSSLKRHLSSLRQFAKYLIESEQIRENPFQLSTLNAQISTSRDIWHIQEFKDFLKFKKSSPVTIKNYVTDVHAFRRWHEDAVREKTASFPVINNAIIEDYKAQLLAEQKASISTINRRLSSLRKYVEFAIRANYLSDIAFSVSRMPLENAALTTPHNPNQEYISLDNIKDYRINLNYSPFPPIRLIQRLLILPYLLLENAIATKASALLASSGIFTSASNSIPSLLHKKDSAKKETRILSSMGGKKSPSYSNTPSINHVSFHKKIWHHARHTRPQWYRKYQSIPAVKYIHLAVLLVFCMGIAIALYENFLKDNEQLFAAPAAPPRILSFQGRLTDNLDNPITAATDIRFAIYNDLSASGSALLWQEVHSSTIPDQDGVFSVLLGTETTIPQDLFASNTTLYLGVTIGTTPELTPRRQIASVAYAANSETLQGMLPITALDSSDPKTNTILALDSSGDLNIGGTSNPSPTFAATSGQFELSGKVLLLSTVTGTDTNVVLKPDGIGKIDLQKPLINSGTLGNLVPGGVEVNDKFGVLATESAVAAFTVNNNDTGDLFTASSSGVTRFTIGNDGTLTIPTYNTAGGIFYANGSGTLAQTSAGIFGQCLKSASGGTPTWGSCGSGSLWEIANGAISPINKTADLLIGSNASTSAKFAFLNVNGTTTPVASISAITTAKALSLSGDGVIQTVRNNPLTIGGNTTGNITLAPLNQSGSGIVNLLGGNLKIGDGIPDAALNGEDLYVNGTLEVDSQARFDNTLTVANTATFNGTAAFTNEVVGTFDSAENLSFGNSSFTASGGFLDLDVTSSSDFVSNLNVNTTQTSTGSLTASYGINNAWFSGATVAGTANQTVYGIKNDVLKVGADTTSGTINMYGIYSTATNTGSTNAGTKNTYGGYFDATGDSAGASSAFGVYIDTIQGADNNYALCLDCDGSWTSNTVASGIQFGTDTNGVNLYRSANDTLRTDDSLSIGTNLTTTGSVTFSSLTTNGGVLYTNGSGQLAQTGAGTSSQCLIGGTTPSWGSCGNSASAFSIVSNGTTIQNNITTDFLLGGTSTSSAKFAFLNTNQGTPTASISANSGNNALYITGDGTVATTNRRDLILGNSSSYNTTGNVLINTNGTGNVGIGTGTPQAKLDISGSGNVALFGTATLADQYISLRSVSTGVSFGIDASLNGGSGAGLIQAGTSKALAFDTNNGTFGSATTPDLYIDTTGNVGIGDVTPTALLTVGNGDLFQINSSGAIAAATGITSSGTITFSSLNTNGGVLYTNGSGQLGQTTAGSLGQCLQSAGGGTPTWGSCGASPLFTDGGTTTYLTSLTDDFALGGTDSTAPFFFDESAELLTLTNTTTGASFRVNDSASDTTPFIIDANGSVGIGVSTPSTKLHVNGGTGEDLLRLQSNSSTKFLVDSNGNTAIGSLFTPGSRLSVDGNLSIGSSYDTVAAPTNGAIIQGSVGIGTSSPNAKFQIFSELGTAHAASISATTAKSTLLVTNDGVGDLFTASASGATKFTIKNNGNVNVYGDILPDVDLTRDIGAPGLRFDVVYATGVQNLGSDFAEYFKKANSNEQFEAGQLVCLENGGATKCDSNNPSHSLLGVVSDNAGFIGNGGKSDNSDYVIVGLVGQVGVQVAGEVKAGDPLTISPTTGVAVAAKQSGYIIGRAMEGNEGGKTRVMTAIQPKYYSPNLALEVVGNVSESFISGFTLITEGGENALKDAYGNTVKRASAFSDVIAANIKAGGATISDLTTDTISGVTATISNISTTTLNASKATIQTVTSGTANIASASINSLQIGSENVIIAGTSLRDYIAQIVTETLDGQIPSNSSEIISPVASINEINTNIISPLADEGSVQVNGTLETEKLIIENNDASGSAATDDVLLEVDGSASVSGRLATGTLTTRDATVSGTLYADNVKANSIDGLDERIAAGIANSQTATPSSPLTTHQSPNGELEVGNLYADLGVFSEGLTVLGSATASQLTAMDSISVGTGFIMTDNSINTLGKTLEIQPLRQGDVSFMAGKVKIDTDGNVDINGNLNLAGVINAVSGVFSGDLQVNSLATNIISPLPNSDLVIQLGDKESSASSNLRIANAEGNEVVKITGKGDIVASGSATFNKFNLNLVGEALAETDTTAVATGSAGFATLNRYQNEITIYNENVTKDSLIYITPFGNTQNKVLYLLRQVPGESFTIGVNSPTSVDLQFNWLIVN